MQAGMTRGGQGGNSPMGTGKNKGIGENAPDGPARVVKSGDWGAVPDVGLKGFPMSAFNVPGRAAPKSDDKEVKLVQLAKDARKAEEAHKRALEKAIQDGQHATQAAQARGREEGLREGERIAAEKYAENLESLQNNTRGVLTALSREKASLFLEFEGHVLELVSGCIHKVFEGLASEHAEAVLPLLKKAVTAIGEAASLTIKIHPADFRVVDENRPYWLQVNEGLKDIRIVSDERISKGGCFVESDLTSVSAHAQEMADRIDEELKKVFLAKLQSLRNQLEAETGAPIPAAGGMSPAIGEETDDGMPASPESVGPSIGEEDLGSDEIMDAGGPAP